MTFAFTENLKNSDQDSPYDRIDDYEGSNDTTILDSRIIIKFGSDEYLAYKQFESYGTVEIVSNIGGLLGLFFGISMFSLIEIVYFYTIRLIIRCILVKKKNIQQV